MFGVIEWWLRWFVQGLKLFVLVAGAVAAAGAIYMMWEFVSIVHPGWKGTPPDTVRILSLTWKWLGHSVQLAMFTYVLVSWFPEVFPQVLEGGKSEEDK